MVLIAFPLLVMGQSDENKEIKSIREAIEESTFLKAQDYRFHLGLSLEQSILIENILRKYNMKVRDLIKDLGDRAKKFQRNYNALKVDRDKKLAFLNDQQLIIFKRMEVSELNKVKNYYHNMLESLKGSEEFVNELSIYHMSHQNTVLNKHKELLEVQISEEDSIAFIDLRKRFNTVLDVAIEKSLDPDNDFKGKSYKKIVKATSKDLPDNKLIWKNINKYYKKYRKPINNEYDEIVRYHKEWSIGIKTLMRKHVPYEKTQEMNQLFFVLTQFGVDRKINKYAFLLYDSSDIGTFYEFNSKFEQLFIHTSL